MFFPLRRQIVVAILFNLVALATIIVGPFISAGMLATADRVGVTVAADEIKTTFGATPAEQVGVAVTVPNISPETNIIWSLSDLVVGHPASGCYAVQRGVVVALFGFHRFTPVAEPAVVCR